MITLVLESLYYCCFGPRKKEPTGVKLILDNLEALKDHEIRFIADKFHLLQKKRNLCC